MVNLRSYTTQWAERALRPFIDTICFSTLNLSTELVRSYNRLGKYVPVIADIACRIVFMLQDDNEVDSLGYSFFQYRPKKGYSLVIRLNKKLFEGATEFNTPRWRKLVGKHEILHCLSALFCIPGLNDDITREKFKKEYDTKMALEILSFAKIEAIKEKHEGRTMDSYAHPTIFFSDDHYRLSPDKAPLKYHNLYEWLLLPIQLFESYFNETEKRNLKRMARSANLQSAYEFANTKIDRIVEDTQYEEPFVIRRIKEILLSYAI